MSSMPPSPQSWHLPAARSQRVMVAIFNPTYGNVNHRRLLRPINSRGRAKVIATVRTATGTSRSHHTESGRGNECWGVVEIAPGALARPRAGAGPAAGGF